MFPLKLTLTISTPEQFTQVASLIAPSASAPTLTASSDLPVDIAYALSPEHSKALAAEQAAPAPQPETPSGNATAPTAEAPARGRRTATAAVAAAPAPTAVASSPAAASAEAPPPASTAAVEVKYDDLRAAVFKLAAKSKDAAIAVNTAFGVKTMKDLEPARWAEALTAVNAKLVELGA